MYLSVSVSTSLQIMPEKSIDENKKPKNAYMPKRVSIAGELPSLKMDSEPEYFAIRKETRINNALTMIALIDLISFLKLDK